jgi:hypothetical protein
MSKNKRLGTHRMAPFPIGISFATSGGERGGVEREDGDGAWWWGGGRRGKDVTDVPSVLIVDICKILHG